MHAVMVVAREAKAWRAVQPGPPLAVVAEGVVKLGPPVSVVAEGVMKPGPPLLRMNRYILAFFLWRGWSGFHAASDRAWRGWSGFHRGSDKG